jgi:hypothetical protein
MNRNLKLGLGIGCGVVALLFLLLLGGGVWFARNMGREYKVVQASEEALIEAHGDFAAWTPPAGLVPAPERVAAFASVRTRLGEWGDLLATGARGFATARQEGRGVTGLWRQMRAGSDLGLLYAGFWSARNRILLEEDMGPGEYAWFYALVYYAWLGQDPGAGADSVEVLDGGGVRVTIDTGGEADAAARARRRLHALLVPALERAEAGGGAGVSAQALADERERLAVDPLRVPWQDGLPEVLAAAFAPHRGELAAAWREEVNPVELIFDVGNWTADRVGD